MNIIEKAKIYSFEKHADQLDDSGASYYYIHILQVVNLVKIVTDDENIICAAYLHDIIEDTDITYEDLKEKFNKKIADLVYEVTKEENNQFPRLKNREAIMIKFADRLSNVSRMDAWSDKRKQKYLNKSKFWRD